MNDETTTITPIPLSQLFAEAEEADASETRGTPSIR
jgi:hypothetical protein